MPTPIYHSDIGTVENFQALLPAMPPATMPAIPYLPHTCRLPCLGWRWWWWGHCSGRRRWRRRRQAGLTTYAYPHHLEQMPAYLPTPRHMPTTYIVPENSLLGGREELWEEEGRKADKHPSGGGGWEVEEGGRKERDRKRKGE